MVTNTKCVWFKENIIGLFIQSVPKRGHVFWTSSKRVINHFLSLWTSLDIAPVCTMHTGHWTLGITGHCICDLCLLGTGQSQGRIRLKLLFHIFLGYTHVADEFISKTDGLHSYDDTLYGCLKNGLSDADGSGFIRLLNTKTVAHREALFFPLVTSLSC